MGWPAIWVAVADFVSHVLRCFAPTIRQHSGFAAIITIIIVQSWAQCERPLVNQTFAAAKLHCFAIAEEATIDRQHSIAIVGLVAGSIATDSREGIDCLALG